MYQLHHYTITGIQEHYTLKKKKEHTHTLINRRQGEYFGAC